MSEWWTYGLRDLLLFSPRTYWRMFELYNVDLWPAQLLAFALGIALLALSRRGGPGAGRGIAVLLAACWLWVAWAFHWQRYAGINWAAGYFAIAFAAQALLLLWLGAFLARLEAVPARGPLRRTTLGIFVFALFGYPLMAPLAGRSWAQAEIFGMAPDPTALATLGMLLLAGRRLSWVLLPIPLAWCLVSGATLWAMASPMD